MYIFKQVITCNCEEICTCIHIQSDGLLCPILYVSWIEVLAESFWSLKFSLSSAFIFCKQVCPEVEFDLFLKQPVSKTLVKYWCCLYVWFLQKACPETCESWWSPNGVIWPPHSPTRRLHSNGLYSWKSLIQYSPSQPYLRYLCTQPVEWGVIDRSELWPYAQRGVHAWTKC